MHPFVSQTCNYCCLEKGSAVSKTGCAGYSQRVDGLFVFPELFHVFCETKSQCAAVRWPVVFSLDCTLRSRRKSQDVAGCRKHGRQMVEGSTLSM